MPTAPSATGGIHPDQRDRPRGISPFLRRPPSGRWYKPSPSVAGLIRGQGTSPAGSGFASVGGDDGEGEDAGHSRDRSEGRRAPGQRGGRGGGAASRRQVDH